MAAAVVMYTAFTGWLLQPRAALAWIGLGAAAAAVVFALAFAPKRCPAGDIEALIEATREEQRFPGLDGHFTEWEQELTR